MKPATFSPALEAGRSPLVSLAGRKTSRAGRGHVPVSRSVWPERKMDRRTVGTFGLRGGQSSRSADLQLSLESRLVARLRVYGLSRVRADLEKMGYAFGACDLCAAGVSAPMVSQRLHWVASSHANGRLSRRFHLRQGGPLSASALHSGDRKIFGAGLAEADRYHGQWWSGPLQVGRNCLAGEIERGGRTYRAKWRVKPGISLLADGVPGRVDQLCGFGNAIVPQLAAEFVRACMECL